VTENPLGESSEKTQTDVKGAIEGNSRTQRQRPRKRGRQLSARNAPPKDTQKQKNPRQKSGQQNKNRAEALVDGRGKHPQRACDQR